MPVDMLARIFQQRLLSAVPAAGLEDIVEGYYWYACRQRSQPVWATLDGHPALLFLLDAPYRIRFTGGHNAELQEAFLCCGGLQNTYISGWPEGMRLLVVRFTCDGLYRMLQQPLLSVARRPVAPVTAIFGQEGLQLAADLRQAAGDRPAQTALLNAFFQHRLPAYKQAGYLMQEAVRHIRREKGQLSVQELCRRLRVNYKWLERNFRKQLGITPKAYINTIRFLYTCFSMGREPGNLTGVALQGGYYDQNHFIKECRRHTGRPPSQFPGG